MSEHLDPVFVDRMRAATTMLDQALALAAAAAVTEERQTDTVHEAIQNFVLLRKSVSAWNATALQSRYHHRFITLIKDAILWLEATRDGGNDIAALHDMQETISANLVELCRLIDELQSGNQLTT